MACDYRRSCTERRRSGEEVSISNVRLSFLPTKLYRIESSFKFSTDEVVCTGEAQLPVSFCLQLARNKVLLVMLLSIGNPTNKN